MKRAKIIKNGHLNLQQIVVEPNKNKVLLFTGEAQIHTIIYDEQWALQEAVKFANKSKCKSKRGVVIWHRRHGLISGGWNAPPLPLECDGSEACRANCAKTAVHAEQAALMNAINCHLPMDECEMIHVKSVDGHPVVSEKPSCWQCSKLILAAGLKAMWLYQVEGFVRYTPTDFHDKTLINCELK